MFDIYGNSFSGSVLPSSPVYICGVSEDYLEVCAKAAINAAYEDIEKNYSLPQTVLQTAERNKSETDAFERLRGNYNIGLKEQIIFPEIEYDKIDSIRGMNISITTTAKTDEEAKALLAGFSFPFRN